MAYQLVNNLRYGQVSSKMAGRFDLDMYSQGAKLVENFICMRQGGITRRPPEKYLATVPTDTIRIVSMIVSTTQAICIALSKYGFESYTYGLNKDGSFSFVQFTPKKAWPSDYTPTVDAIKEMCFAQHYDYLYVTCDSQKLGRFYYSSDSLTFQVCNVRLNMEGATEKKKKDIKTAGFSEDTLMTSDAHYPSGCAIVSDRLLLFGTQGEKDTVWWSRVLGTSQTIEEEEDSLLDFTQYDAVETTTQQFVEESKIPKTKKMDANNNIFYHTEEIGGGSIKDAIYNTSRAEEQTFDGTFTDEEKAEGKQKLFQAVKTQNDTFGSSEKDSQGNYKDLGVIYVFKDSAYKEAFIPDGRTSNKLSDLIYGTDYYKWPYWEYDLSDTSKFIEETTETDYVATSTTAMKMQLATGRMDKVIWVSILDNVYIGTDTSVWAVPTSINALAQSAQRVSSHALYDVQPSTLGGSVVYAGKGGKVRGLSYSESVTDSELTLTADGIIDQDIVEMVELSSPEPTLYVLLSDGSMRTLTIDTDFGLQGWAVWRFSFKVDSIARIEDGSNERLLCLCSDDSNNWIGFFDYDEAEKFADSDKNGELEYTSTLTMHRMDSYSDSGATLGVRKSIRNIVFRPMDSGKAVVGYSDRDMETTPKALGSSDYKMAVGGGSVNELCFTVKSYEAEPLTLLAVAYEATVNQ
jgi:hypothetical protein